VTTRYDAAETDVTRVAQDDGAPQPRLCSSDQRQVASEFQLSHVTPPSMPAPSRRGDTAYRIRMSVNALFVSMAWRSASKDAIGWNVSGADKS
jgi:hypothetical protein